MLTLPLLYERGRVIINDFHTFYHCRVNKIVLYYFEMLQFFQYLFRFFFRKWDKESGQEVGQVGTKTWTSPR